MTEKPPDLDSLRPVERRVLKMRDSGVTIEEIAARIKKSPSFVHRLIEWTEIPRSGMERDELLTPLQARVLALSAQGEDRATIAQRFKRSERFIRQVEGLAHFRKGLGLMTEAASLARRAEQSRA